MTVEEIYEDLQARISPKRFKHILGVTEVAGLLAAKYGANPQKARLAGLLHDCAKELSLEDMISYLERANMFVDHQMLSNGALLHGAAGAAMASLRYEIKDSEVLEAVRVHTTGKVGMTILDKVVFLADYIEPSRDFPGVEFLRQLAAYDLDQAVLAAYDSTISLLLKQKQDIYTATILGRNDIIFRMKELHTL